MSRYAALTAVLLARKEAKVILTFDELDAIVGILPNSAKTYGAWWANKRSSQPHAKFWLDAHRKAAPDFRTKLKIISFQKLSRPYQLPRHLKEIISCQKS